MDCAPSVLCHLSLCAELDGDSFVLRMWIYRLDGVYSSPNHEKTVGANRP